MAGVSVFITGSTGFIGKIFVHELLKKIDPASTVYLLARSGASFDDPRVRILKGDLASINSYVQEIRSSDYVFHLAANATFGNDAEYDAVNYESTKKLITIARGSERLKNFIFVSTIGAVDRQPSDHCTAPITANSTPHPTSRYGQSKLKAENYLKLSSVPYTIVRPSWVYGPDMRHRSHINTFVSMAFENSPLLRLHFPGRVSIIHVRDLALALANLVSHKRGAGKTYMAATEVISLGDMFDTVHAQVSGRKHRQLFMPRFRMAFGVLHRFLPLTISNLFVDYLWSSDNDFIKLLDSRPSVRFKDGITDVINTNVHKDGYWMITGANSGIGHALAKLVHQRGGKMILVDKNTDKLAQFADSIIKQVDLSDTEGIRALAHDLQYYKIFRLINNAGIGYRGNTQDISDQQVITTIRVNIEAPVLLTKLLLPQLATYNGTIVNVASSAAHNPLPGMSVYAASKSFILNWSTALWYELLGTCRVITVSPSGTNTNFQATGGVKGDGSSLLSADHVAEKIISAIECKGNNFLFLGTKNRVVAFVCKFFPPAFNSRFWGTLFSKMR